MEEKYSIFQVYDYKGGELSSQINLNKEEFIDELCYKFDDIEGETFEEMKQNVLDAINDEDFIGEYAGWEPRFCGKLFKHVDNSLEEVYFTEFIDDIVSNIDKYNED